MQGCEVGEWLEFRGGPSCSLKGGAGVDVFALGGNTLTGSIDGEANGGSITGIGSATLTTQGATTGFNGTAASVISEYRNVSDLGQCGELRGGHLGSTWSVDTGSYSDGTRSLTFGSFATLQGGTGIDTFNLAAGAAYNPKSRAGEDTFGLPGQTQPRLRLPRGKKQPRDGAPDPGPAPRS